MQIQQLAGVGNSLCRMPHAQSGAQLIRQSVCAMRCEDYNPKLTSSCLIFEMKQLANPQRASENRVEAKCYMENRMCRMENGNRKWQMMKCSNVAPAKGKAKAGLRLPFDRFTIFLIMK